MMPKMSFCEALLAGNIKACSGGRIVYTEVVRGSNPLSPTIISIA